MELDLFENEQKILDNAVLFSAELKNGEVCGSVQLKVTNAYDNLVNEYAKLLRQLRRSTRLADRTTVGLHEIYLDLAGKVNYDALTGIYNRRYMESKLNQIMKTIARSGGQLSVMMIDIDFFKRYNDTYGHGAGDDCLKSVSKAIAQCMARPDDFTARYGGEEFSAILPHTDENGACMIATRMLETVRALDIPHETSEAASCITISIGITTGNVEHTQTGTDYLRRADEALYISKHGGRNRFSYLKFYKD